MGGFNLGVGDGQGGLACCNSWGRKELDTTERLNLTGLDEGYYNKGSRVGLLSKLWEIVKDRGFFHAAVQGGGGLVAKSCLTLATPSTVLHQAPLSIGFSSPWGVTKSWT